jgi:hypothetical protein
MGSTKNYRARSQTMQVGKPPIYQTKYFSLQQKKGIKLKTDKSRKYYCTTRVNICSLAIEGYVIEKNNKQAIIS